MEYNIIAEIYHGEKTYYGDDKENLYTTIPGLSLPNHPIIDYKKFNNSIYFEKADNDIIIKEGLETLLSNEGPEFDGIGIA